MFFNTQKVTIYRNNVGRRRKICIRPWKVNNMYMSFSSNFILFILVFLKNHAFQPYANPISSYYSILLPHPPPHYFQTPLYKILPMLRTPPKGIPYSTPRRKLEGTKLMGVFEDNNDTTEKVK